MTRKEAFETKSMLHRLEQLLSAHAVPEGADYYEDAAALRRVSMTLHRWHELECGTENGSIERGEDGKPLWRWETYSGAVRYNKTPDREAGALARLKKIMARYPSLSAYVQTDPRGASLYILRPGDVPSGETADAYYSRGMAVHS